ncbi:MAG: hypothetical protein LBI02_10620 [Opitutaceae bacterium]|nr:hypothetical protein [Opitutaceae bacterium]
MSTRRVSSVNSMRKVALHNRTSTPAGHASARIHHSIDRTGLSRRKTRTLDGGEPSFPVASAIGGEWGPGACIG